MSNENETPATPQQETAEASEVSAPPVETPPATPNPVAAEPPTQPVAAEPPPQAETPPPETPPQEAPNTNAEGNAPPERVVPEADGYTFPKGVPADFGKFANKMDMTQEQADGVLQAFDAVKKSEIQAVTAAGKAHIKNWGDRAEFNMGLAKRAMKQYDVNGKLSELLNTTGHGSHPVVLDFFYTLGQGLQEGGFLKSELKAPGQKTRAQRMYPNMKSETL